MADLKILVWEHREPTGDPDVEVKIPASMAKWVPRMMRFVPRKTKEEVWGGEINFDGMFDDIEKLISEAAQAGNREIMVVRAKDTNVKILIEK